MAPLAAVAVIALVTRRMPRVSALVSLAAGLLGFGVSAMLFSRVMAGAAPVVASLRWLSLPGFEVELGFTVDRLSALMLLVVTGVGFAIQVYSLAYMRGDAGFARYFACLSFFMLAMLGLVVSTNFVQIYLFWEMVGLASYLLIGFWFERDRAAAAGRKALILNRIGDAGMLLGILVLWTQTGSLDFAQIAAAVAAPDGPHAGLGLAALLIFCGAVGKSAQLPLHVWLPDAMEGPTPVSALIHAATMVAAGVYLLCRVSWLIVPPAADVIAWVGGLTALFAALIAIGQSDIKRVLAYSTVSQLGYMVMAVGLGGELEAMWHLTAHAFFKALLFLAAGSVLLGLHHEQDIWKMGGLARKMPGTFAAFLVGTLALAGVWPLSGFYTKDEILMLAFEHNPPLFLIAAVAAACTAFYMGRVLFVAFFGKPRDRHLYDHAHEQGAAVLLPLAFLSALSICAGWHEYIPHLLKPEAHLPEHPVWKSLMLLMIPALGFAVSAFIYLRPNPSDQPVRQTLGRVYDWITGRFYVDEFYGWLVRTFQDRATGICTRFEAKVLQARMVEGSASATAKLGWVVRVLQSGDIRFYVFVFGLGAALLMYLASHP